MSARRIFLLRSLCLLRIARCSLILLSIVGICVGQTTGDGFPEALGRQMHLTTEELVVVQRGDPVVKTVRAKDRREVAVYGIVRLPADPATSFKAFQRSMSQQKSDRAANGNRFGNPPHAEDLQTLTLSRREIADLQRCSIGDCKVKLSAHMIERFQNEIDWNQIDRDVKAVYLFHQILIEYVKRYVDEGDAALIEYRDGHQPVRVSEEYESLFSEFSYLQDSAPELVNYLHAYPHHYLAGVTNEIVWARVSFGLKPVVIITHQTTYESGRDRLIQISKQIYANHYFDSSLGLTAAIGTQSTNSTDSYLLYVNHSRAAALDGAFSGLKRRLVEHEAVSSLSELLLATKANLQLKSVPENSAPPDNSIRLAPWIRRRAIWLVPGVLFLVALIWFGSRISRRKNSALTRASAPDSSIRQNIHSGVKPPS